MNVPDTLICQNCQTANPLAAYTCASCGAALAICRAQHYLDLADQDILTGQYAHAGQNLILADREMLTLSAAQRRESLLSAYAFLLQAIIYYQKGQIGEARNELDLALQNVESVAGGRKLEARILNQLGNVAFYESSAAATDYYQRSSKVAVAEGEHGLAATSLGNLGIIYFNNGEMEKAFACYNSAAHEADLAGEPARRGNTYRLLATFYASQGPYSKALEATEQALSLLPQITNSAAVCRITNVAGRIYLNYGDREKAEHWLRYSDEVARQNDNKLTQVENAVSLAQVMRLRGNYAASLNYALRAYNPFSVTPLQRSEALSELITYYIEVKNLQAVRKYLKLLEEVCARNSNSTDLLFLHRCHALLAIVEGRWEEAANRFARVVTLAQDRHDKYGLAELQEEYATYLLNATTNAAAQAQARKVLAVALASYREMEMPLRVARAEAKLNQDSRAD